MAARAGLLAIGLCLLERAPLLCSRFAAPVSRLYSLLGARGVLAAAPSGGGGSSADVVCRALAVRRSCVVFLGSSRRGGEGQGKSSCAHSEQREKGRGREVVVRPRPFSLSSLPFSLSFSLSLL